MNLRRSTLRWRSVTVMATAVAALSAPNAAHGGQHDGRWVLVQKMTTIADVPVVGEIEATTVVVSLHDLSHTERTLTGTGKLCRLSLDSGSSLIETIIPKALRRVLPRPVIDAELVHEGGILKLRQAKRVAVVGARLDNTETDPLPRKASDRRVFDQDGDEQPGVTIRVEGIVRGDLHVVQRSWTRFDGALLTDGTFGGRLFFGNEQIVLGATSPLLGDPPASRPATDRSWFRLARLDGDANCKDARRVAQRWTR